MVANLGELEGACSLDLRVIDGKSVHSLAACCYVSLLVARMHAQTHTHRHTLSALAEDKLRTKAECTSVTSGRAPSELASSGLVRMRALSQATRHLASPTNKPHPSQLEADARNGHSRGRQVVVVRVAASPWLTNYVKPEKANCAHRIAMQYEILLSSSSKSSEQMVSLANQIKEGESLEKLAVFARPGRG